MGKPGHFLLSETDKFPTLNPRPCLDVGHAVLTRAAASEVLAWRPAGVNTGETYLKNPKGAKSFVTITVDSVYKTSSTKQFEKIWALRKVLTRNLFWQFPEKIGLPLIWSAATMPEEEPLDSRTLF